ncbi:UNVERIFIED_CONTAM: hypothetical protein K2H54_038448, partial [Gekko kuhli]
VVLDLQVPKGMVEIQVLRALEVYKVQLVFLENRANEVAQVLMELEGCRGNLVLRVTEVLMAFLVYLVIKVTGEIVDRKDLLVLLVKME